MNPNVRSEILQLLAEGKISAAEAMNMLDKQPTQPVSPSEGDAGPSLKEQEALPEKEDSLPAAKKSATLDEGSFGGITITEDDVFSPNKNGERPRWLKIRVRKLSTGQNRATITLPIGLVSFGLGVARRFGADFDEAENVEEIWQLLKSGERGVIVDVEDEDDDEHVQIYLD